MRDRTPEPLQHGPIVVVEIGTDWLKIAQVEKRQKGGSISRLHLERFEVADGTLSKSIANAFARLKLSRRCVVATLPRQMVNIRMLDLPSVDPEEIVDMVDLQSSKQTPYSQEEIVSDYRIVGSMREGYTRVMLAIVQSSALRQRFAILEEAGIEAVRMSANTEGLLSWYRWAEGAKRETAVLLDIDSASSEFMVVSGGGLLFTRSILMGANHLLTELEKWKDKFAREVKQSLEMCLGDAPGISADRLLVTGAGRHVQELVVYLGGQLNLPAESRDALQHLAGVPAQPPLSDPAYQAVSLTPVAGVALAPEELDLNLIPDTVRLKRSLVTRARGLTAFAMLLFAALLSASLYVTTKLFLRAHQYQVLREQVESTRTTVLEVERMNAIINAVRKRQDLRLTALSILNGVSESIPPRVYPDSIEFSLEQGEQRRVTINGTAESRDDTSLFVRKLEQSPLFRKVTAGPTKKEGEKFRFQIACPMEVSP